MCDISETYASFGASPYASYTGKPVLAAAILNHSSQVQLAPSALASLSGLLSAAQPQTHMLQQAL